MNETVVAMGGSLNDARLDDLIAQVTVPYELSRCYGRPHDALDAFGAGWRLASRTS
ncbi:hypothetical protein [Streptomyces sp. UNOB3_S3]|uniref:hypothetical protein n=1 Tax=Streptomyces sp. UNOB3_S3 TaxID=2871682 RepID=UPI001E41549A|nr:hypothetical protein [Streptomyces sp. UNOB3_S3]MCC3776075.1 hypothetical protein [Streptomyces sp. UNOB3_S3]